MRKTFGTGSVWEQKVGYSRAVQVDNTLYISATAASGGDGIVGEDFYTQTRFILDKLGTVLAAAGSPLWGLLRSGGTLARTRRQLQRRRRKSCPKCPRTVTARDRVWALTVSCRCPGFCGRRCGGRARGRG